MNEKTNLTIRIGKALARRSSRRGFLRFAGAAALGLGVGLHGVSLTWALDCYDCPGAGSNCNCSEPDAGNCCLRWPQGSCGQNGTYACTSTGCDSRCTQESWNCCFDCCSWTCAECCCNYNGCSCAIKYNVSCGGCHCAFVPEGAAA